MKSYTDLEQSEKLAEILSIETADGTWVRIAIAGESLGVPEELQYRHSEMPFKLYSGIGIPSWSLAALLTTIPYAIRKSDNEFYRLGIDKGYNDYAIWYSNNGLTVNDLDVTSDIFVDTCVKMILKLHEQNLL